MEALELGRPTFFDVEKYLDTIEGFINADEIERAFWLMDNAPAYFRDHPPARLVEIRQSLHRQLFTPVQYKDIYGDFDLDATLARLPGRARILRDIIKRLNDTGKTPHLMEYAPGSFWIPKCFEKLELNFTYDYRGLERPEKAIRSMQYPEDSDPFVYLAFEIIEHLSNEWELYQNYLRFNRQADVVMLSTPLYTCMGGEDGWRQRDLGHLRTYSPGEFLGLAQKMFTGYSWQVMQDETIILIGSRNAKS